MKREGYQSKVKEGIKSEFFNEIRNIINRIKSQPLNTIKGGVLAGISFALVYFADKLYLLLLAFSAANPPLLTVIVIASSVIGLGIVFVGVLKVFLGAYLYSGAASEALTEIFEEQLDEEEMLYYKRLKGDTKECKEITEEYEQKTQELYESRSKSLGVNLEDIIEAPSDKDFQEDCEDCKHFLTKLYTMHFKKGLTDGVFSDVQKFELETLFNNHFSIDTKRNVSLSNLDLIEGISIDHENFEKKSPGTEMAELDYDSEISTSDDADYRPDQILCLTKQAINHLKIQSLLKKGRLGDILAKSNNIPFTKTEINKAHQLLSVLHRDYNSAESGSRISDLFYIFAGKNKRPNSVTINFLYVLLNNTTHGTLKNSLPTDDVFLNRKEMIKFINDYKCKGATLGEAINIAQCFSLLLEPNISERITSPLHAEELPHAQDEELHRRQEAPLNSRKPIYEDDEEEGDSRHLDL